MRNFLIWCSGADRDVLEQPECALVRDRYAGLGLKVVFVSVFAGLAMVHLLRGVFGTLPAILLGALWSAVIFNLDRFMLGSLIRTAGDTTLAVFLRKGAVRLLLAGLVAAAVSEPLIVAIFRHEIALQVEKDDLAERESAADGLRRRQALDLTPLDAEERAINDTLRGLDDRVAQAYQAASQEADGVAGTMTPGRGPRWSEKRERYDTLRSEYRDAQRRAAADLHRIRDRRAALAGERDNELQRLGQQASGARGFLRDHMALERLGRDPEVGGVVRWRVLLIRLLFFSLEILPLVSKLFLPRSPYDALFQQIHDTHVRAIDSRRDDELKTIAAQDQVRDALRTLAASALEADLESPDTLEQRAPELASRLRTLRSHLTSPSVHGQRASAPVAVDDRRPPAGAAPSPATGDAGTGVPAAAAWRASLAPSRRGFRTMLSSWRLRERRWLAGAQGIVAARARSITARTRRLLAAAIAVSGLAFGSVAVGAAPYLVRPCQTGPCPIAAWVDTARAQIRITDRNGTDFATWPGYPMVTTDSLPPFVVPLVEAVEDRRYFRHHGVDPIAVASAAIGNLRGKPRRGASTVTMQAVRGLDRESRMWPSGTWRGKLAEARVAVDLERRYSKSQILELYLNTVDLGWIAGTHVVGINHASWMYFGKPAARLTLGEAATLVGMIRGPQLYHPISHQDRATARRNLALQLLAAERPDYADQAATASEQPLQAIGLDRLPRSPSVLGLVAARAGRPRAPMTVRSTIDGGLQNVVAGELDALIRDIEGGRYGPYALDPSNRLTAGAIVMDSHTGRIRAYVCGRPLGLASAWDPCSAGRVLLNSVAKVFLLLAALDEGVINDRETLGEIKRRAIGTNTSPYVRRTCAGRADRDKWAVERLIAMSDNCLAVAIHQLLPAASFEKLNDVGIDMNPTQPATALGTGTISLLQLSTLIAALAADGTIPNWEVLERDTFQTAGNARLLPFRNDAQQQVRALLANVVRRGTAAAARSWIPPGVHAFAKTGTDGKGQQILLTGAAGTFVVSLWVGHEGAPRPITESLSAGTVLGARWGRIAAAALEAHDSAPAAPGRAETDGATAAAQIR